MLRRCYGCMMTYEDYDGTCPHCGYVKGTVPENAMHLMPGVMLNNRFVVGKVVGYGGFGVTYLGWDNLLEQKVAIKEYLPSEFSTRAPGNSFVTVFDGDKKEQFSQGKLKFVEEAKKLAKFTECQGIVKVFDSFVENDTAYIAMEYIDGITLENYLKENNVIPAEEAVLLMLPVIESLKNVHESGVIHRDIAPNNIMVAKNGDVKVIDFGAARFATATHTKSMTVIIKPGYSPEEQYMSRGDQGPHTDVYAVGATMYRMITGVVPPDAMERRAQFQAKGKDILEPISKYNKDISKNLENAIMNAMNVETDKRTPDMETFMYELTTDDPVARRNGKIKITDVYRWPTWLKITLPVVAMFMIVLSVLFGMGVIGFNKELNEDMQIPDGMVQVPWVVNKTQEEASVIMNDKRLLMTTKAGDYSEDIEAGMVMAQETAGGVPVPANSRVYVTLSRGREMKTIPSSAAVGSYSQNVIDALEELEFNVIVTEEQDYSNIPAGIVTKITDEEGQPVNVNDDLPKGATISLITSKGPNPDIVIEEKNVNIPRFIDLTKLEAYELAGTDIRIEIQDRYKEGYAQGVIWYQNIEEGKEISNSETIILYASLSDEVKVPGVTTFTYTEAAQMLEALGLKYELEFVETEEHSKDIVFEQSVPKGNILKAGDVVVLTVSAGPPKQDVPSVAGMDEAVAKDTLLKLGFAVAVNYENSDTIPIGKVISQDIAGTKLAVKGDTITLVISSGEKLLEMPDVVGEDDDTAIDMLEDMGFIVKVYEQYDDIVPAEVVISQSETAGASVKKNTEILLIVSMGKEPVVVPDVVGKSENDAAGALEVVGFTVNKEYKYSKTVTKGNVISQSENGGTSCFKGTCITITISEGVGEWSEWTTDTSLKNNSKYEYETKSETQWRYKDRYTKTSNQESLSGWSLYNTTWEWSGYGGWSDWSTNYVAETDAVHVENKTRYKYRDKQYTTGTSNALSGWNLYNTTYEWGSWSAETTNVLTAPNSDSEVSSRPVTTYKTVTMYRGKSLTWRTPNGGEYPECIGSTWALSTWWYGSKMSFNKEIEAKPSNAASYSVSWYVGLTVNNYKYNVLVSPWTTTAPIEETAHYGKYKMDNGGYYYEYETKTVNEPITTIYYKIRNKIYTYHFWKWNDWSGWSDNRYTASSEREVSEQTVYRYCTRSKIYTYYFEKYSDWSSWSKSKPADQSGRSTESRQVTYYRYRLVE